MNGVPLYIVNNMETRRSKQTGQCPAYRIPNHSTPKCIEQPIKYVWLLDICPDCDS